MAWQAVLAQAASGASDYLANRQELNWKNGVTSRLDLIAGMINEVLEEINALRPFITEALKETVLTLYKDDVNGNRQAQDVTLAGAAFPLNGAALQALTTASVPMLAGTYKLLGKDPNYELYPTISVGVIGYVHYLAATDANAATRKAFADSVLPYFDAALDPANPTSWAKLRADVVTRRDNNQQAWDARVNKWWQVLDDNWHKVYMRVQGTIDQSNADNPEVADQGTNPQPQVEGFFPEIPNPPNQMDEGNQRQAFVNQFGMWRAAIKSNQQKLDEYNINIAAITKVKELIETL